QVWRHPRLSHQFPDFPRWSDRHQVPGPQEQRRTAQGHRSAALIESTMLAEHDFQKKADALFEDLKKRLLNLGDEHDFDVEGESGKLEVIFEEPQPARFVISPNTPIREIWVSALSTSFKLAWSEPRNAFILGKTGE